MSLSFDCRATTILCKPPPTAELATPNAFANLDLRDIDSFGSSDEDVHPPNPTRRVTLAAVLRHGRVPLCRWAAEQHWHWLGDREENSTQYRHRRQWPDWITGNGKASRSLVMAATRGDLNVLRWLLSWCVA